MQSISASDGNAKRLGGVWSPGEESHALGRGEGPLRGLEAVHREVFRPFNNQCDSDCLNKPKLYLCHFLMSMLVSLLTRIGNSLRAKVMLSTSRCPCDPARRHP